jgi:hypothetical protein
MARGTQPGEGNWASNHSNSIMGRGPASWMTTPTHRYPRKPSRLVQGDAAHLTKSWVEEATGYDTGTWLIAFVSDQSRVRIVCTPHDPSLLVSLHHHNTKGGINATNV